MCFHNDASATAANYGDRVRVTCGADGISVIGWGSVGGIAANTAATQGADGRLYTENSQP